jgi:4-hydroxy-tetrahydrodipicolinate reductase
MKIALIGHGAMGNLIEQLATEKDHEIAAIIDENDIETSAESLAEKLNGADVAIDFSVAEALRRNVEACVLTGVPVVVGTTGWKDSRAEIEKLVTGGNGALVFGANFSIGVNLFYKIAEFSAELFARFPGYEVFIEEQHHSRKKDAPSGTALKIKDVVSQHVEVGDIAVTRAGNIPGTHRVGFDGPADQLLLQHVARSREGFALGAIMAAEWIVGKKGFFEFGEVLDKICQSRE